MTQFKSFPSFPQNFEENDMAGELYPDVFAQTPPPITNGPAGGPRKSKARINVASPIVNTDQLLPLEYERAADRHIQLIKQPQTGQLVPGTGALDVPATQSLIAALQSTMTPSRALRKSVVIPGEKKRDKDVQRFAQPSRRMPSRLRHGIIFGSLIAFLFVSLITLSPLKSTEAGMPLVGNAVGWVNSQQQNWDTFTAHLMNGNQQAQTQPQQQNTAPQLPNLNLPMSQYIAIARQDAIDAGIPPNYFVRQIMTESSFNPNAVSPLGAVGIAQFLPSTAAALGFNPYDPVSALQGAARYMASLSNQYNGDYAKALAAYNAGGGTVVNAVSKGGANWMDFLPPETRNYIFKIMGI